MDVNLETNETEYDPGDVIQFCGCLVTPPSGRNGASQHHATPQQDSLRVTIVVSLVDEDGLVLAAEVVEADSYGAYSGRLLAPPEARGEVLLIAEAAIDSSPSLFGAFGWYGQAMKTLIFPINVAPQLSLATTVATNGTLYSGLLYNGRPKPIVSIAARVIDPDRSNDIELITVTVRDVHGTIVRQWDAGHFHPLNHTWVLNRHNHLLGVGPWIVTLTAEDSVGNVATTSQVVRLTDIVATL